MDIQIKPQTRAVIDKLIASGRYPDTGAVISAALRLMVYVARGEFESDEAIVLAPEPTERQIQEAAGRYDGGEVLSASDVAQVEELVETGTFANHDAIIEVAINDLETYERKLAWLKAELVRAQEQIDRGETIEFTPEYAKRRIQEAIDRYHARNSSQNALPS